MSLYDHRSFDDHAEITFATDKASGLRAIIALHRVWERPSVGGCRLRTYDTEEAALDDVLRLSRGMTYKSVMAGLSYGGAKAVI
ncbi:MAG: Glu/Leu/Phe/Val dehydrogenase dimerization domain-containing protein, partial [Geminicoccaceae bacterium]